MGTCAMSGKQGLRGTGLENEIMAGMEEGVGGGPSCWCLMEAKAGRCSKTSISGLEGRGH